MKKHLSLLLIIFTITLTACTSSKTSSASYKDGIFEAVGIVDPNTGYQDKVIINIDKGRIIEVDYNGFNTATGADKKTASNPDSGNLYTYNMVDAGAQSDWYEQAKLLEKYVINNQNATSIKIIEGEKTDSIAGVSIKAAPFVDLVNQALLKAKKY